MMAPASPALRVVRTVLLLWLTFILTQPVPVHACAMRNGKLRSTPAASLAARGGTAAHHVMVSAMSGGDMGAMDHGAPSPSGERNQGCHCFGDCTAAAPVALPTPNYSAVPAPAHVLSVAPRAVAIVRSFEPPTHLHPPATAPPIA